MRLALVLSSTFLFIALCHALSDIIHYKACVSCEEDGDCALSSDFEKVDKAQLISKSSTGVVTYKGNQNHIRVKYSIDESYILLINEEENDGVVNVIMKNLTKTQWDSYTILYQVPALQRCLIKGFPTDKMAVRGVETYVKKDH